MKDLADRGAVGGETVVAREGEVGAAARRGAVHRRQHRLRRAADQERELFAGGDERRAVLGEDVQVRAGAERPAGAREDDDAHLLAVHEHPQGFDQVVAHGAVEGVELVGPIERHGGDAAGDLHGDPIVRGHQQRSTIIAMPWPTPIHMVAKP